MPLNMAMVAMELQKRKKVNGAAISVLDAADDDGQRTKPCLCLIWFSVR